VLRGGLGDERAAEQGGALAHADLTGAVDLRGSIPGWGWVVGDDQLQGVEAIADQHACGGAARVLDDVSERLLHDTKRRQVDSLRQRARLPLDRQLDIQAGGA
jgi:hypothetical protein